LSWRNSVRHEENILTWHGQDRTLLVCMTSRGELLLSYEQGVRSGGRVVKLKSPTVRCKYIRLYEKEGHTFDEAAEGSSSDMQEGWRLRGGERALCSYDASHVVQKW
jgi:hypothetical protein